MRSRSRRWYFARQPDNECPRPVSRDIHDATRRDVTEKSPRVRKATPKAAHLINELGFEAVALSIRCDPITILSV